MFLSLLPLVLLLLLFLLLPPSQLPWIEAPDVADCHCLHTHGAHYTVFSKLDELRPKHLMV